MYKSILAFLLCIILAFGYLVYEIAGTSGNLNKNKQLEEVFSYE